MSSVSRRQSRRLAVLCGLAGLACGAQAADDELPDLEFLEYLGTWEGSDEEWLLFDEAKATAAQEEVERSDRAAEGTVPGKESTELENES